jgi:NAD-dependent dihydropyrimidine dehydrogenase PreA subunit
MKRSIIHIDEDKCTGCGLCIPACPEGALQVIDGKARLISDIFCDGLGACIGDCPEGAIQVVEREAEAYDEYKAMENISKQGANTILAHLDHLRSHGQDTYLNQALEFLHQHNIPVPSKEPKATGHTGCACPGSANLIFTERKTVQPTPPKDVPLAATGNPANRPPQPSALTHWPVQMHLLSPHAPQYANAELLLAADCVAFSMGDFHGKLLAGKALAIACPKLDQGKEIYIDKLVHLIDDAKVNSITVAIMVVPCCGGLLSMVHQAAAKATRKVPIHTVTVSLQGEILERT